MEQHSGPPIVNPSRELDAQKSDCRDKAESTRRPIAIEAPITGGGNHYGNASKAPKRGSLSVIRSLAHVLTSDVNPRSQRIVRYGHDAHLLTFGGERHYQEQN
jgi:hypothetical protein